MNQTTIRYIWAGFWGAYAGVGLGYLIAKKTYKRIADEEIESVKALYQRRQEASFRDIQRSGKIAGEDLPRSVPALEYLITEYLGEKTDLDLEAQEIVDDLDYYDLDTVEGEDLESNIEFEKDEGDENAKRRFPPTTDTSPDTPYVISVDEFLSDEPANDKVSLVYYEGDDILATETDKVVRNVDKVIGDEAIARFGDRSGSEDTVYVRNERLESDYEVTLDERSYQEVALRMKPPKPRGIRFQEDRDS